MSKIKSRFVNWSNASDQDSVNAGKIPAFITSPSNYTPTQVSGEGADKISAFLKGIDQRFGKINAQNVLVVKKNPAEGEYATVAAAIAAITSPSATNPWVISVGPGEFVETALVLPNYTALVGTNINATIIKAANDSFDMITLGNVCEVSFLTIKGLYGVGKAAVVANSTVDFSQTHKVSIYDFDIGIKVSSVSGNCVFYAEYTDINGDYTNGVQVSSVSNNTVAQFENFYTLGSNFADAIGIVAFGQNTEIRVFNSGIDMKPSEVGMSFYDGAKVYISSVFLNNGETGIQNPLVGAGVSISATGFNIIGCINDISILNPSSSGSLNGTATASKTNIADSSSVSVLLLDPATKGLTLNGAIKYTQGDFSKLTDISQLIINTPTMGVIYGGELSAGAGLTLNVAAGFGYNMNGTLPNDTITRRNWSASSISMPANSVNYVFINETGALAYGASFPDTEERILLGRVITNGSSILFIDQSPLNAHHASNSFSKMLRKSIGAVFVSGSGVSENTTRKLNVTPGNYFYAENEFNTLGGTPITFQQYYSSASPGNWTIVNGVQTVTNTQYDAGSGVLSNIPVGKYAKHLLILLGGSVEKYILILATAYYDNLAAAQAAPLPMAPSYMTEGFVRVASIVITPGLTNIQSVIDERPRVGFASSSTVGGLTDHGGLTGLLDDDHPQYLKVDGTRAMSGALDMGGNNITNVNLVDGVDVSAHAARHLPLGSDPLTTAAAVAVAPDNLNGAGIANSFSKSDHTHSLPTGASTANIQVAGVPAAGTANTVSRSDHVHVISVASSSVSGALSSTDWTAFNDKQTSNLAINKILVGNISGKAAAVDMSGEASIVASGAVTLSNSAVISKVLTGYLAGVGTVQATDSILQAIQKLDANDGLRVLKAGDTMTGFLTLSANPTSNLHAATKQYVDTADALKVAKAGDTMTGFLTLSADPTNALHAASKQYVDTADALKVAKAGDTMTGFLTLSADPTLALHAATKQYVDSLTNNIKWKDTVRLATTVDVTLSGLAAIDGVTPVAGDRILVRAQANATQNGIYVAAAGAWSRSLDADTAIELRGATVFVDEGSTLSNRGYTQVTDSITLGVTNLVWVQNFGTNLYVADGTTITLVGNTFSIASNGITNTHINTAAAIALTKLAATTPNRALVSNGSGIIAPSTVLDTELAFLSGVTSSVQTQLNSKLNLSGGTMTGAINMGTFTITNAASYNGVVVEAHASRHLPSGADPLTTAAPVTSLSATTTDTTGTANSLSRSDHVHSVLTGVVSTQNPDLANSAGVSSNLARADHIHNIPAAISVTSGLNGNVKGVSTSFALADHQHNISLPNYSASSDADTSTTSTTFTAITGMSVAPAVAGTYLVNFSSSFLSSGNGADRIRVAIFANGVQVPGTEIYIGIGGGSNSPGGINAIVTVAASQAIEIRWRATAGTATAHGRVINTVRIGD
jgi:hypothetical protein